MKLYKRNAQGKPLMWQGVRDGDTIVIQHGIVGGTMHKEVIDITLKKVDELESRIKAKRKEGYKLLTELKDNYNQSTCDVIEYQSEVNDFYKKTLLDILNTYLPKYSTTSEGFVLPMLAKVLEDNKPFDKYGAMLGQWKINGLRCIIGAERNNGDLFKPISLTYHSRTGEDWTRKMSWMDDIILDKIGEELLDAMLIEGACLDGELYLPGYSVNDINSFVKNDKLPQHYKLQYWCYDICVEGMSASARDEFRLENFDFNGETFSTKEDHLNNKKQLVILPTYSVYNIEQATSFRNSFIDRGFEGLIVRNPEASYQFGKRNQAMFKYKKIDDGLFEIVNIKEDKRGLPIYVMKNDINSELFECTINLSQAAQKNHLSVKNELIGKKGLVEFRERSGVKQVPFHAKLIKIYI